MQILGVTLCIAITQKTQRKYTKNTNKQFTEVHTAQVLTYLKLGNYKLGLLLNFYVTTLKNGIKRVIN